VEKTRAILIRRIRFSETSLICVWVSDAFGKIRTSARGALRPGGAFAGQLDLFYLAEIGFARSRSGDLHALREVSLVAPFDGEGAHYVTLSVAAYFADLADLVTEPMAPAPEIFDLLSRAIAYLRASKPDHRTIPHFEAELCRALGIHDAAGGADPLRALAAHCGRIPASRERALKIIATSPRLAPSSANDKMPGHAA